MKKLSEAERKLIIRAQQATQNAYAPYSGFLVGAALSLVDGIIPIVRGKHKNQQNLEKSLNLLQ